MSVQMTGTRHVVICQKCKFSENTPKGSIDFETHWYSDRLRKRKTENQLRSRILLNWEHEGTNEKAKSLY
jgi:hypothetical protein